MTNNSNYAPLDDDRPAGRPTSGRPGSATILLVLLGASLIGIVFLLLTSGGRAS